MTNVKTLNQFRKAQRFADVIMGEDGLSADTVEHRFEERQWRILADALRESMPSETTRVLVVELMKDREKNGRKS